MRAAVHQTIYITDRHALTRHAWQRMSRRSLSPSDNRSAIIYGRTIYGRGAKIYIVGRKEVRRYAAQGVDLRGVEGVHVVCTKDDVIQTAYRNHDLAELKSFRHKGSTPLKRKSRVKSLLSKLDQLSAQFATQHEGLAEVCALDADAEAHSQNPAQAARKNAELEHTHQARPHACTL